MTKIYLKFGPLSSSWTTCILSSKIKYFENYNPLDASSQHKKTANILQIVGDDYRKFVHELERGLNLELGPGFTLVTILT